MRSSVICNSIILTYSVCIRIIQFTLIQMRIELEKIRRRLEVELADVRDQLAEKTGQLEDLQALMIKREEELQKSLNRFVSKCI